ncbi:MAG: hypothetical protein ABSF69_17130 [Polyangiaceae bacterium]|jgi:hypothetical protein
MLLAAACGGSSSSKFGGIGPSDLLGSTKSYSADASTSQNPNQFGNGVSIQCSAGTNNSCTTNTTCAAGKSTTISGTVYDPAGVNPIYSVTVYVPGVPANQLPDLSTLGVPATLDGAAPVCGCDNFYPPVVASAVTDATGHFEIADAPYGKLTLVVQTGKWRMVYENITITQCSNNELADKSLRLPRNATEGNLPEIAISTGGSDSLECLPLRIGVDAAEYAAGAAGPGHVHIFQGYNGATTAVAAPASGTALWNSDANLDQNDVVLFSCEGSETHNMSAADQQHLLDYSNAGGRVFLSHFHYAWLRTGPFAALNLGTWLTNTQAVDDTLGFPGDVNTTFYEGNQMSMWLGNVAALNPNSGIPLTACPDCTVAGSLPVFYARHNVVTLDTPPSNEWIRLDPSVTQAPSATQYFSFDTPVGGATTCGRVVYSDLHVSGGPAKSVPPGATMGTTCTGAPPACFSPDYPAAAAAAAGMGMGGGGEAGVVPTGCRGYGTAANDPSRTLSPQEKALEFMLFDLSSCLVPVTQAPTPPGPPR